MNSSRNVLLPMLYESPMTVFSMAALCIMTGEGRDGVMAKKMNYYVKNGMLLNPRRGFYAKKGYKPEELACQLYPPCYISLEYVLQKAGVVFQYDSAITAVSYLSRSVIVDGREFRYRKIKGEIAVNSTGVEHGNGISMASPERAFLDVLYLSGEYHFDNLRPLSYKKVLEILPIYKCRRLEERVKTLFSK